MSWDTYIEEDSEILPLVDRWFSEVESSPPALSEANLDRIVDVYAAVAALLDENGVYLWDDPTLVDYGALIAPEVIGLGQRYFSGTTVEQYGTLIHELTHAAWGTSDLGGYFENPGALLNEDPVMYYNTPVPSEQTPQQLMNPQPSTAVLLNNADTYTGFITQYYSGFISM